MPPRNQRRNNPRSGAPGRFRRFVPRRRICHFCVDHVKVIDYKDIPRLRRYITERAKIAPKRKSGVCAGHQRALAVAIKRARHLAMLPFASNHTRMATRQA